MEFLAELAPRGRLLIKPYLVILYVALVYLFFPSNHFNADGLHYSLLGFMSVHDPGVLLRDEAVPTHFLWHLLTTGVLVVFRPVNPQEALYILRVVNIAFALGAIVLFLKLVRSYAGDAAAAWATLMLAFCQACLVNFLAVEVYSLNTLVLVASFAVARRIAVKPSADHRARDLLLIALLCAIAIATHLANILLVPTVVVALCLRDPKRGLWQGILFGMVVVALVLAVIGGIAAARSLDLSTATAFFFNYSGKQGTYLTPDILGNFGVALRSGAAAVLGRGGLFLAIPASFFLVYAFRHRRRFSGDLWVGALLAYLAIAGIFLGQWDPENTEHKIALIPALLLLLTSIHARIGVPLRGWALTGTVAVVLAVVIAGLTYGVVPFTRLDDDPLYRLATEIHDRSAAERVLVVGLASAKTGHAVTLASMTFFEQQVAVLHEGDDGFEERLLGYRGRGFAVLSYEGGRIAAY